MRKSFIKEDKKGHNVTLQHITVIQYNTYTIHCIQHMSPNNTAFALCLSSERLKTVQSLIQTTSMAGRESESEKKLHLCQGSNKSRQEV